MGRLSFWKVLSEQQSRLFPFFLKAFALLVLLVANTYLSAWVQHYSLVGRVMLILPWYFLISLIISFSRITWTHAYLRRNRFPPDHRDNFTVGVKRLGFVATHVVFFFVLLFLLNIPVGTFFTSISIFAVALVLIFRDYIASFLNGITVMFSRSLRIRDYVRIGDQKGRVTDITFLHVELLTDLGDVIYIPNHMVLGKELTNFSQKEHKQVQLQFTFPLLSAERLEELEERLRALVQESFSANLRENGIRFQVERIEKDAVTVSLRVWLNKYSYQLEQSLQKRVSREVLAFTS